MFLLSSYCFLVVLWFFFYLTSISVGKNKKIQALVKFYMFLIQKIGGTQWQLLVLRKSGPRSGPDFLNTPCRTDFYTKNKINVIL